MKKTIRPLMAIAVVLLATILNAGAANGWRGGGGGYYGSHGNVWVGPRYYGGAWGGPGWGAWGAWGPGWWWPPAYPYYVAPPVVIEQQPRLYIQPNPPAEDQGYWYYCQNPPGYYPYVKKCPNGWMKVVPPTHPDEGEE